MKVYVDLLLMANFIIDFMIIFSVAYILKRKIVLKKVFFASLFGSFSILVLFINLNSIELFFLKMFLSSCMLIISFEFRDIKYFANNLLYFYINSVIIGGFIYIINTEFNNFFLSSVGINFTFLVIISPIILYIYSKRVKALKLIYKNKKSVTIYLNKNDILYLDGYVDSGNTLKEPFGNKFVIIANSKEILDNDNKMLLVPYKALNHEGIIKCIVPDKVYIEGLGIRYDVVVGVSTDKIKIEGVNCLLNILMEE